MRKIPTRLRGTNFCTSSARIAPSFVRQPNGPECTQMVQNAPKRHFRVQCVGSCAFVAKNSDATSCSNFCTSSDRFVSTFVRQPNGLECTQMVRSATKRQFRVQWGGSGAFVAENSDANIFTSSARFAPSFVRQPNGPECTQMVLNTPKRQFRVQWVGPGAFVAKYSDTTSWHERTSSARFAPIFVRHPNGPECTQ